MERISDADSDAYFATRARGSQIGAWASQQSRPLASMTDLEAETLAVEARFPGEIPRPPFWGGYRVVAERIELWYDRPSRLHDRPSAPSLGALEEALDEQREPKHGARQPREGRADMQSHSVLPPEPAGCRATLDPSGECPIAGAVTQ